MKKELHEVFGWAGPITFRQFQVWQAWFLLQLNRPSRSDHYLMRVAQRVAQVAPSLFTDKAGSVTLDQQKVEFIFPEGASDRLEPSGAPGPPPLTVEQATAASKAVWAARLGLTNKPAEAPDPAKALPKAKHSAKKHS